MTVWSTLFHGSAVPASCLLLTGCEWRQQRVTFIQGLSQQPGGSDQCFCQTSPSPILRLSAALAYASGPWDLM